MQSEHNNISMKFEINEIERKLLLNLKKGIEGVNIYKSGIYPIAVTLVLAKGRRITLRARNEGIGPRFEVFPICVSEEEISVEPNKIIDGSYFSGECNISVLQKSEWSVVSSEEEKLKSVGNTDNATTQYEGRYSEIPEDAVNHVTLHTGIEVKCDGGYSFIVATSMFPFALYVTDCEFSELVEKDIYASINLC